jgi:hypothetical protein
MGTDKRTHVGLVSHMEMFFIRVYPCYPWLFLYFQHPHILGISDTRNRCVKMGKIRPSAYEFHVALHSPILLRVYFSSPAIPGGKFRGSSYWRNRAIVLMYRPIGKTIVATRDFL